MGSFTKLSLAMPTDAYVAKSDKPGIGLIVIQEIFGLNPFVTTTVDAFAELGFCVVAPDLFGHSKPLVNLDPEKEADRAQAMQLLQSLDQERALDDIEAHAAALRDLPECNGSVAVVGYCLGGRLACLSADRHGIDAAVGYYGIGLQQKLELIAGVSMPLLLHIGAEDQLCPPAAQDAIMEAAGTNPKVRVERHAGVGHAFARRGGPAHRPGVAATANAQTIEFLNRLGA